MTAASFAVVLGAVSSLGVLILGVIQTRINRTNADVDRTAKGMSEYMTRLEGENTRLRDQAVARDDRHRQEVLALNQRATVQDERINDLEKRHGECENARRQLEVKVEVLELRLQGHA